MMLTEEELARVTEACRSLPQRDHVEDDFVTNLLATVIDFQTSSTPVKRAMAHYRATRYKEVRSLTDLKSPFRRWTPTHDGNTALAVYGYRRTCGAIGPTVSDRSPGSVSALSPIHKTYPTWRVTGGAFDARSRQQPISSGGSAYRGPIEHFGGSGSCPKPAIACSR